MRLPDLFIFDMDGLIFDSERAFMETLAAVMKEHGYTLTRDRYVHTLGLSMADTRKVMLGFYGPDYPYEEISQEGRRRLNARAAEKPLPVKKGIPELLSFLEERGVPRCVASSSPRETVRTYLASAGLADRFDFVVCGDDITHSKPDPEIFLLCCRHFGTAPEDAVVLEDSENGIRAAVNGRIPVICIPDMKTPAPELLERTLFTVSSAEDVIRKFSD